ncbi:polysaccharide biosynthesis protein [Vibrio cholerae]|uniref:oligosaccharide flippase family protein n=2 Tax=Vibrio TaxID=662 RepID=UPI00205700DD|nr:oligosaccharide flippase family protein [Vibrio cholerae]EKF9802121.1 oligosaccharide flippase family protein [Vibrio cholerae]MDV2403598.1 oligosaccharide flippase family protein [Vibrio cholerae]BCN19149.1 putative O-antigen flippase [Vibrio cholerae]GIB07141.1 polysaccharide biosynthesis protein [Vibrio cholerae]
MTKQGLISNGFIYFFSNIVNSAIPFLLLPILTRILSPEGYGLVTMFTISVSVLSVFIGISINGAISVHYFKLEKEELSKFISSSLIFLLFSGSFFLILITLLPDYVFNYISVPKNWLLIAAITSIMGFVININLVLYQVRCKAIYFGLFQVLYTLFNSLSSLSILYFYNNSWEGRALGIFVSSVIFAAISMFALFNDGYLTFKIRKKHINNLIKFGVPLIPHALSALVLVMIDRVIISGLLGEYSVGIYTVAIQLSMVVAIMADAFVKAYGPWVYDKLSKVNEHNKMVVTGATYIVCIAFLTIIFPINWVIGNALNFLVGEEYYSSAKLIIWFLIGNAFSGMYFSIAGFYFFSGKTGLLSVVTVLSGAFSISLTYLLVDYYGLLGGAVSFALSNALKFMLALVLSHQVIHLPWSKPIESTRFFLREIRYERI